MLTILAVFSKNDLETFFKAHPFRKKLILWRMKKAKITFNEKYYFHLKSRIHGNFWLTEKHLVPIFFGENRNFALAIEDCPFCIRKHFIHEDQIELLSKNCPLLVEDLKYIARQANFTASKMASVQTKNISDKEFTETYINCAKELANDLERGKIIYFPTTKNKR